MKADIFPALMGKEPLEDIVADACEVHQWFIIDTQ